MEYNRFRNKMRRVYLCYDKMMEKQGFTIVLVICVLVIVLSALYTFYFREEWNNGTSAEKHEENIEAGGMQNAQSLAEAQRLIQNQTAKNINIPTEAPFRFSQPVQGFLDRDFSMDEPQLFANAHYWRLHPGIDLQADFGTPVTACADGKVLRVWQDAEKGICIRLLHDHEYQTLYAGLCDASYVKAGDPVMQGQTIGHLGNGVIAEADAEPHLHFEVWKGNTAVDPIGLFLGIE